MALQSLHRCVKIVRREKSALILVVENVLLQVTGILMFVVMTCSNVSIGVFMSIGVFVSISVFVSIGVFVMHGIFVVSITDVSVAVMLVVVGIAVAVV